MSQKSKGVVSSSVVLSCFRNKLDKAFEIACIFTISFLEG